jgi:hypothetical protein
MKAATGLPMVQARIDKRRMVSWVMAGHGEKSLFSPLLPIFSGCNRLRIV